MIVNLPHPTRSIHPQGWVPIETHSVLGELARLAFGSIHPQGWVPIETVVAGVV